MGQTDIYSLKILILGEPAVGKTSLRRNYLGLSFEENYQTTLGFDISIKNYTVDDIEAIITIWDIGGQENFRKLRQNYYRGAAAALLVYDVTRHFDYSRYIKHWLTELKLYSLLLGVPVAILGNKIDLLDQRQVTLEDGEKIINQAKDLIGENPIKHFETSAKESKHVNDAFEWIINGAINNRTDESS